MKYAALATDGDGTLVRHAHMAHDAKDALIRWKAGGRKLILVTGETEHELSDFPHLELFDRVVAENGALILAGPGTPERELAEGPPNTLLLRQRSKDSSTQRC